MSIIGTGSVHNQYNKIAGMASSGESKSNGPGFQDVLAQSLRDASQAVKSNEQLVKGQVVDRVDLTKLTTDTAQLDVMVSTITALREKVINAIQELQKMPI